MSGTNNYSQQLTGYRFVKVQVGDSLLAIAARELKNASAWASLAWINGLVSPYIGNVGDAPSPGIVLPGANIIVPAAGAPPTGSDTGDDILLTDIQMGPNGLPATANGDFAPISGPANYSQAISNALSTDQGTLLFHLSYGTRVRQLIGKFVGPANDLLASKYVEATIAADPRTASVPTCAATGAGNQIAVTATAVPISGEPTQIAGNY